jgi:3-methyladenine DNA glycosylase AlkD
MDENLDVEGLRKTIVADLASYEKPGGNPKLQAYLGSPFPVLGLSTPEMRGVMKAKIPVLKQMSIKELNILAQLLWSGSTLEEKSFAISLLGQFPRMLDAESWSTMEDWIDQIEGWALCDSLGSGPISAMLYQDPSRFDEVLRWARSENFWKRRVSLYALRDLVFTGELEKPFILLRVLLYDKEFWVQRAVGTWLRECWKKDRQRTEAFLLKHVKGMPRIVITVATERAPKKFRDALRASR